MAGSGTDAGVPGAGTELGDLSDRGVRRRGWWVLNECRRRWWVH